MTSDVAFWAVVHFWGAWAVFVHVSIISLLNKQCSFLPFPLVWLLHQHFPGCAWNTGMLTNKPSVFHSCTCTSKTLCTILRLKALTLLPTLLRRMQKILREKPSLFSYSETYFISPLIDGKNVTGLHAIAAILECCWAQTLKEEQVAKAGSTVRCY